MKSKTVAILESRLGSQLADLIARRGGRPMLAPALAEIPDADPVIIAKLVGDAVSRPPAVAIFQTGVGTQALFRATDALGITEKLLGVLEHCIVAVRGPKPTAVLGSRRVRIDRAAKEPFTTAQVLVSLRDVPLRGERVAVQRYGKTNVELEGALRERGAEVLEIPTYRWALPDDTAPMERLIEALKAASVDATVFTSASQVRNLFALAKRLGCEAALVGHLNRTLIASIGPICSAALEEHGVRIGLEASPPKLGPLVAALDLALSR
jgi:uroporphyrinogen-III synthase